MNFNNIPMNEEDFICSDNFQATGIVEWSAPSNIAIIKYLDKNVTNPQ